MSRRLIERITIEAGRSGGRPCIRDSRIRVRDILALLAAGATERQILEDFPVLEPDDIRAALQYAAVLTDHPSASLMRALGS
ncbi:MAG: DUF433 domain-containing protein [Rhodocyclaceae bacterium]|nr:DUF433 domain-containing protein [Rhodocyclaceae bacterium]MBX3667499.1 DUF433 domain-containing protein [Rhodocyclaceae bacterium]